MIERFTNIEINNIIKLYNNRLSMNKLSKQYNCSDTTIKKVLIENNIYVRNISKSLKNHYTNNESHNKGKKYNFPFSSRIKRDDEQLIVDEYIINKLSLNKIMKKYNVSLNYLRRIFKDRGLKFRSYYEGIKNMYEKNNGLHPLSGKNCHLWNGGKSKNFKYYGYKFHKYLKNEINKYNNYICQLCLLSKNELLKNHKLCVHHIDYNKFNNSKENLITLCSSCHGKTNLHRDYWQKLFTKRDN